MHEWPVKVSVNGRPTEATVEPRLTLADYLAKRAASKARIWAASTVRAGRAPYWSMGRRCAPA